MEPVLFINACFRDGSRTRELAEVVLQQLGGSYTEVKADGTLPPLDHDRLHRRLALAGAADFSDPMFDTAKQFKAAETIVIAAPYWDLSFPAALKAYIENICVVGLTFYYLNDVPKTLCRAKRLIYVTTVGGYNPVDFGFSYVEGVAKTFFEIPEVQQFRAEALDIAGNDPGAIMAKAKQHVLDTLQ